MKLMHLSLGYIHWAQCELELKVLKYSRLRGKIISMQPFLVGLLNNS